MAFAPEGTILRQVGARHLSVRSGCENPGRMDSDAVPYPLAKKVADKGITGLLLVLLAPVFGVACGAIGLDRLLSHRDRGPWLYRERRISRGREFDLLKFRTLRVAALAQQSDEEAHARLLESDPENLTWAGRRILKPWYLDELPQLFNVLRGDMSLVGPRPWPPSMVQNQVEEGLDYRNRVLPGWTGPVQVQKGVVEPAGYTQLDLAYVEACRAWSGPRLARYDLGILWRTVKVLARGEGLTY
jgi:lipopolysaccharide/colanic/teichoic acid biosynthesis glycosyltransferase